MVSKAQISQTYPTRRTLISADITLNGVPAKWSIVAYYQFFQAIPGSKENAPEPETVELNGAYIANSKGQALLRITDLLCNDMRQSLENSILETRRES